MNLFVCIHPSMQAGEHEFLIHTPAMLKVPRPYLYSVWVFIDTRNLFTINNPHTKLR